MTALCIENTNVKLSFSFDAMTIYFKTPCGKAMCSSAMAMCSKLPFVQLKDPEDMIMECLSDPELSRKLGPIRYVHREDPDHGLYHLDNYQMEEDHCHLKFTSPITLNNLWSLLEIFTTHDLINKQEMGVFLMCEALQLYATRTEADKILDGVTDPNEKVKQLILYIKTLEDNNLLLELHQFLLSPKFDFLRENLAGKSSIWQGTDRDGNVVKTNKNWALIEKTITLQIEHNIVKNCQFNQSIAKERTAQISRPHTFFCVKHNVSDDTTPESPSITAFLQGNRKEFDDVYDKHFNKCA